MKNLITEEAIIKHNYEIEAALELYSKSKLNPNQIIFINPESYSLYQIGNLKLNNKPETKYTIDKEKITIGKKKFHYPFHIFDQRKNTMVKINNLEEFKQINL